MPAVETERTGRTWSCWPWSCSRRSRPVQRRPLLAMETPTSRSCLRSYQPRSLGPTTATSLPSSCSFSTARSSSARASGSGAQSSWSSQSHCTGSPCGRSGMSYASSRQVRLTGSQPLGRFRYGSSSGVSTLALRTASSTAVPKPERRARCSTRSAPRASVTSRAESSALPVSAATACCTGRSWPSSPARASGSQRAPSCETRTAVTTCRGNSGGRVGSNPAAAS